MANGETDLIGHREVDLAMADLVAQTENEPVSPQLAALVNRLAAALEDVRRRNDGESGT